MAIIKLGLYYVSVQEEYNKAKLLHKHVTVCKIVSFLGFLNHLKPLVIWMKCQIKSYVFKCKIMIISCNNCMAFDTLNGIQVRITEQENSLCY